jgi:hypothetical protein
VLLLAFFTCLCHQTICQCIVGVTQDIHMCALVLPSPTLCGFNMWVIADQNINKFICQLKHYKAKFKESMMGLDQNCLKWMVFYNSALLFM